MKSICAKIVIGQILSIIIRRNIIDMYLIASLNVIEKQMTISHIENHFLHSNAQALQMHGILGISGSIGPRQQCVKQNDRFIEIPNEYALRRFDIVDWLASVRQNAACGTGMSMTATPCAARLCRRRGFGRNGRCIGRYRQRRVGRVRMRHQCGGGWMCVRGALWQTRCHVETLAAAWPRRANVRRIAGWIVIASILIIVVRGVILLSGTPELGEVIVAIAGVQLRCIVIGGRCCGCRTRIARWQISIWRWDFWRSRWIWGRIRWVKWWRILLHAIIIIIIFLFVFKRIRTLQIVQSRCCIRTEKRCGIQVRAIRQPRADQRTANIGVQSGAPRFWFDGGGGGLVQPVGHSKIGMDQIRTVGGFRWGETQI